MPNTKSSSKPSARDRIMQAASTLFYQEGVQKVGVDRIIAESGVAKMSLYNHFKSKDSLIAAWLEERDTSWRRWFQKTVEKRATTPTDRLLAMFDALEEWFSQPDFRGCAFINSSAELVEPEHPGYQVALKHQQAVYEYILQLVYEAEIPHPEAVAEQLLLLMEGSIVVAMMRRHPGAAIQAKAAAARLI
ncbi:TetR/AcrR family transcriptional regulator [Synechocystis salina]|uniref:TetR/AcrR family transcriptional regulator n=1 Tax=Synechocystis salina LEGE 00031 TaxID=1828736 RepID=A0ABR9VTZ3_9SYNC|nr:TetR/AcrR family transcriptional regulator [Synechocystis salina]MBE9241509.1 TetR/AcrR family transcriptional regulator [Synechocystis salina LEGE 00041]MBE9254819.1 TetR/AcrR family transcriptional regulator [Synechocystis salina LEGE 00031]